MQGRPAESVPPRPKPLLTGPGCAARRGACRPAARPTRKWGNGDTYFSRQKVRARKWGHVLFAPKGTCPVFRRPARPPAGGGSEDPDARLGPGLPDQQLGQRPDHRVGPVGRPPRRKWGHVLFVFGAPAPTHLTGRQDRRLSVHAKARRREGSSVAPIVRASTPAVGQPASRLRAFACPSAASHRPLCSRWIK